MKTTAFLSRLAFFLLVLAGCLLIVRPTSAADRVVGDGSPGSCNELNLNSALTLVQNTGSWSGHVSGGGITAIGAVNLFANGASSVYYDDMSLTSPDPRCDVAEDIPWVGLSATSGATAPAATDTVQVYFDSTALSAGTYHAALCVLSNDPDPGNGTELVIVPLEMVIEQPTDVGLSALGGEGERSFTGVVSAAVAFAVAGLALAGALWPKR